MRDHLRKQTALLLCIALLTLLLSGCAAGSDPAATAAPETAEAGTAQTQAPQAAAEPLPPEPETTEPPAEEPAEVPEEPADAPEEVPEDEGRGHYRFQPKVCSSYMTELFGEPMRDTWFALVDAVMAGEDHFPCPDEHTYNWVMGQFPDKCFPVLKELIDYTYDREHPVVDGVASFEYLVPREEAAARIAEFAELVEEILNQNLRDDYSDFEKALALYIFFSDTYTYDYATAFSNDGYPDYLSSYRVLTQKTGICQEFSVAYAYLLLQAGVDASNMSGHRSYDRASHQWSYVRIHGHSFHIDPTYVVGDHYSLSYLMMTDEQREAEDCYYRNEYVICSNYAQDHPHPDYSAEDDSFRAIWQGRYLGFDHETRTLYYEQFDGDNWVTGSFDYSGW